MYTQPFAVYMTQYYLCKTCNSRFDDLDECWHCWSKLAATWDPSYKDGEE